MDIKKHERARGILKELAAEYLQKISNRTSLITVTQLDITDKEDRATILITVLPETQEGAAVDFIGRNLGELRQYIIEKSSLRSVPFFSVAIDQGEKNRQTIDRLSRES